MVSKCENGEFGEYTCRYTIDFRGTELFTPRNDWQSFYENISDYSGIYLDKFRLAFEVNGNKLLVNNYDDMKSRKYKIDMAESMYFNKPIDAINLIEDKFIMTSGMEMSDYINTKAGGKILSTPAIKKILYDKQEQEQFFKDFAAEIVKIYSESN